MVLSSLLGTRLTLWLGKTVAAPAPAVVMEALREVEVTESSEGLNGFQLTFTLGRRTRDILDYPLLALPLLHPFSRAIVQVWSGARSQVLIDGFITNHQVTSSDEPGASTLTVTGEDLRVMMGLHEMPVPYAQQPPHLRVNLILAKYAMYLGSPPLVIPSKIVDAPLAMERIPIQAATDLAYIQKLAADSDYVFYVEPTPVPMVNLAYWGPENRLSMPQPALSVNLGPATNVTSLNFQYNALAPTTVRGTVQEKRSGAFMPVMTFTSLRPPLAALPAIGVQQPNVRSVMATDINSSDPVKVCAQSQALTDRSSDAVTADGQLDVTRYGDILRSRRLVGVRGAGWLLDGFYYVKQVSHRIRVGEYTQSFSLVREGFGSLSPTVVP